MRGSPANLVKSRLDSYESQLRDLDENFGKVEPYGRYRASGILRYRYEARFLIGYFEANEAIDIENIDEFKDRARMGKQNNIGPAFEAKVASRIGPSKIDELGKDIPGSEVDALLKDGTIMEAKSGDFTRAYVGGDRYRDLEIQLQRFNEYQSANNIDAGIEVAFRAEPSDAIKSLLDDHGAKSRVVN